MKREYVKGRVYGETINEIVETSNGMYRIEPEARFNYKEIYENHITDLIEEIKTGIHRTPFYSNGELIKSFILEDGSGTKYEIKSCDNERVTINELDSHGNETDNARSYSLRMLAQLIYAHHFAFNCANARAVIKYGPELHEYELAKYWC